ncbi:MAG: response regulator [Opitutales bacterium]
MTQIYILCVDDEPDVLQALARDLASLEDTFPIETAASAEEGRKIVDEIGGKKDACLGLIFCDHVMPGQSGVDFLIELAQQPATSRTQKVLFTGQADLEDTIKAVNQASIHYYVAKPWQKESLLSVTRTLLTDFVLEKGIDPLPYMAILDSGRLAEAIHERNRLDDRGE